MLMRFNSGLATRLLAKIQKASKLVPEIRKRPVFNVTVRILL